MTQPNPPTPPQPDPSPRPGPVRARRRRSARGAREALAWSDEPVGQLRVSAAHRPDCIFGPGFFRLVLNEGGYRYVNSEAEIRAVQQFLPEHTIRYIQRDGYCLDGMRQGDANTPDVVDGETWLGLPRAEAMAQVGLTDEADYRKVYEQVESAVGRRNDRQSQTGVHVPIVIKKRGRPLIDVFADEGLI